MHPGRGGLPHRVQPGDRGPPVQAGPDAAAGVVRAGRDRDRLGRRVDPARPAQPDHRGEIPVQHGAAHRGGVQPEMVGRAVASAGHTGAGTGLAHWAIRCCMAADTTSRGSQVAERVTPGHDRPARRVHQHRTGPAQGLGDEGALAAGPVLPQHRRMELHELDVPQFRAGPGGQRQAVAGQPGRVGGGRVGLAEAAGRQHDRGRGHRARPAGPRPAGDPGQDPAHRPAVAGQGVQHDAVGQDLDPAGQQGGAEHPVHLRADRVTPGVDDPAAAVPALQVQRGALQPGPAGGQPGDLAGRLGDQRRHGRRIAQARARGERVPLMQRRGVPRADGRGQAPLGQRRRAPADPVLAEQQHAAAAAGRGQRRGDARGPGAHDHHVRVEGPAQRRPGQAAQLRAGHGTGHSPGHRAGPGAGHRALAPAGAGEAPAVIIAWTARRARSATPGATFTSSTPSRRQRSRAAGVVIFI